MQIYLSQVQLQSRTKTLALRFLTTAKKEDESITENEIRNKKKNSVFLFSPLDFGAFRKSKNIRGKSIEKSKTSVAIYEEEESSESQNSLEDDESNQKTKFLKIRKTESDQNQELVQKPVFKFLPDQLELKNMLKKSIDWYKGIIKI